MINLGRFGIFTLGPGLLAGYFLGSLIQKSWGNDFYFMAPFGVIGGVLMLTILGEVSLKSGSHCSG